MRGKRVGFIILALLVLAAIGAIIYGIAIGALHQLDLDAGNACCFVTVECIVAIAIHIHQAGDGCR